MSNSFDISYLMKNYWQYTAKQWLPIIMWSTPLMVSLLITATPVFLLITPIIILVIIFKERAMKRISQIKEVTDCSLFDSNNDIADHYATGKAMKITAVLAIINIIVALFIDGIEINAKKCMISIPFFIIFIGISTYISWQSYKCKFEAK